jgi:hypothetical protein
MLTFTIRPVRGEAGGWECRVYRDGNYDDWVVAAWGATKGEAIGRARSNFDKDTILTPAPKGK